MSVQTTTIEVEQNILQALQRKAEAQGVTVDALLKLLTEERVGAAARQEPLSRKATIKIPGVQKLSSESEIKKLFDVINDESDLACVLIATSYVDQTLASLLEKFFIKGNTSDQLLGPIGGALGNFAARADIAYCLGLVPKGLYQNLRTIGEIRNTFAHHYLALSFSDQQVLELTNRLTFQTINQSISIDADGNVSRGVPPWTNFIAPRPRFTTIIVQMTMALLMIGHTITRCERPSKVW